MKATRLFLACLALAFLTSCEDEWYKKDATMGYVVGIETNDDGTCTYRFGSSPDSKTAERSMVSACGSYKLGEGLFVPK